MKKSVQNDFDLEMINLDETAGWNQLEVEAALNEQTVAKDNVFQGEITYEEEFYDDDTMELDIYAAELDAQDSYEEYEEGVEYYEDAEYDEADEYEAEEYYEGEPEEYYEDDYYEEVPVVVPKKKKSGKGNVSKNGKSSKSGKTSSKGGASSKSSKNGKGKKAKKNETIWDKIAASFREMTLLDGIIGATGVLVLVVAIITVSVFSSAKEAERQVAAFVPLGEDMSYLVDAGKGTLIAMADSNHWIVDMEETEEETVDFEYDEKDLEETNTVNVNMKLTSVQKDLKIKFVNYKTGKLISNVKFEVSVTDADKKTKEYTDDDMDGIIYLKDVTPGKATVTMLALTGEKGLAFNTAPQTVKIKDKIEYTKIDVAEEVKSESEVNAAVEDTAKENEVEGELKDTVEWVASTKTEVDAKEEYVKVDKKNISDPSDSAKAFVRMDEELTSSSSEEESGSSSEEESSSSSEENSSSSSEENSSSSSEENSSSSSEENSSSSSEEESGSSESEESSSPEKPSTEESKEETKEESTEEKNPAKEDKVSLLKDKSGNQMFLKNSDGKFVEAKYADYFVKNVTFYKKVKTSSYKYTGWQNIDGKTYFYTKDGEPVKGEQVIQGAKYTFGTDGALMTSSGTLGIDVSKWNGNIDWNAVKNSGVSYVIIRCGYRGSTTGAMIEDPKFKTNIQGALNAGLKVGIYFFSQAVNEVEAVEEASMTIGLIKKYKISYPVFLDVEASGGRADNIDRNTRTQVIKAYCETIKNSGYTPGVYANKTWLNSYMNAGELNSYKIWLAQYNTAPTYSGKFDMWQYSSKGKVSGISGNVDMNLSYMGY